MKNVSKKDKMLYEDLKEFYKHLNDKFELTINQRGLIVIFKDIQIFKNRLNVNGCFINETIECDVLEYQEEGLSFKLKGIITKFIKWRDIEVLNIILKDKQRDRVSVAMGC